MEQILCSCIGVKDSPILAIYSHMVEIPLYLPNYAYGQIIENQIEDYIRDRKFSDEVDRIFRQGKLTPQQWMTGATGTKISAQPLINALNKALQQMNNLNRKSAKSNTKMAKQLNYFVHHVYFWFKKPVIEKGQNQI